MAKSETDRDEFRKVYNKKLIPNLGLLKVLIAFVYF
jgi:hypothetical protein